MVYKNNALVVKLLGQVLVNEILFSSQPSRGFIMKNEKYSREVIWPIVVNGGSTGLVAAHVIVMNVATRVQNMSCVSGRNVIDRMCEVWVNGAVSRMATDNTRATVPPNLFGMDRRMP